MAKYRKNPIVVEAEQFWPSIKPWPEGVVLDSIDGITRKEVGWRIDTLEGPHSVTPGDWIITGVQGEKYPCKPDIFELTYKLLNIPGNIEETPKPKVA